MRLEEFYKEYEQEYNCREKVRQLRESSGIACKKCQHTAHYWKKDKQMWECKACGYRTSLRSGTVMENSNLPFKYWFVAMAHLSNTKKSISALELQRQLDHKRYEPIWAMLQKLRAVMGYRDTQYDLKGQIELDEGFFEAPTNSGKGEGYGKGGDKVKVLVAVESKYATDQKPSKYKKPKIVRYLKMKVIGEGNNNQAIKEAEIMIDSQSSVVTDGAQNFKKFPDIIKEHISIRCFDREDTSTVLPWVHTAISNAKRLIQGVHHNVSSEHLQNYLNEFCYKFNRRYFGTDLFDRMLIASISSPWYNNRYQSG